MSRGAVILSFFLLAACSAPAPRMHVTQHRVSAGTAVVVHLEARSDDETLWLTLVPPEAPDDFVPLRVPVDERATVARVPVRSAGTYEVRLTSARGVLARARVEVERSAIASAKSGVATPLWYW